MSRKTNHLKYSTHEFATKQSDYALIVPVINEGTRLSKLLERMTALQLPKSVDVIVVDGRSTDGSIDKIKLDREGLNSVLIMESVGALGAQLQCAYDFALNRGYRGIVTIDGNNKDNPAGVFKMIDALDNGVDFAQGSRFIQGGVHENTPLLRLFAVRLVHAPLLSLSSGFTWTDTTQGFRAYSRRLLEDPDLNLFRPEFFDYTLLFHVSHSAPRLGFRCAEIPTERIYPKGQTTPTKIKGISALAKVAKSLFLVCSGHYSPVKRPLDYRPPCKPN
jgi:dolichol-phosphate mannosyltransferase